MPDDIVFAADVIDAAAGARRIHIPVSTGSVDIFDAACRVSLGIASGCLRVNLTLVTVQPENHRGENGKHGIWHASGGAGGNAIPTEELVGTAPYARGSGVGVLI
ncbi:hypothetical protein KCP75_15840 [Salmonella enterica subsp. enterica]|nr:hypothetical protein KCP75_15840 [Salmonella enterica subsp. enterica]